MRYSFIAEHRLVFAVRAMCRMLLVHPSGFHVWLREPLSPRALEDQRQTKLIKAAWEESGEVCGYRKLHDDLCPSHGCATQTIAGQRNSAKTSAPTGLGVWDVWRA